VLDAVFEALGEGHEQRPLFGRRHGGERRPFLCLAQRTGGVEIEAKDEGWKSKRRTRKGIPDWPGRSGAPQ